MEASAERADARAEALGTDILDLSPARLGLDKLDGSASEIRKQLERAYGILDSMQALMGQFQSAAKGTYGTDGEKARPQPSPLAIDSAV